MKTVDFVFSLIFTVPTVMGQQCPMLQMDDLGNSSTFSSTGLLAEALVASGEVNVSVQLVDFHMVCLGQGAMRDTFQTISVVVVYRNASDGINYTVQVEYICGIGMMWSWDILANTGQGGISSLSFNPSATLLTPRRLDCSLCVNPSIAPGTLVVTTLEHCIGELDS